MCPSGPTSEYCWTTGPARLLLASLAMALFMVGCGATYPQRDGPGSARIPELPGDPVPHVEPRSRYGNGPLYEVFNKTYTVMHSSAGYQQRGVASWYGKKFHGNLTSNREVYDMYAMTAAHKTLPLPTYVSVRNLRNNRSVIVRVNDRGPFAHNRIIDLSYAAALKLDMVRDGTSLVEVTAYNFDAPAGDRTTSARTPEQPLSAGIFVQVGAFGDRANAARRLAYLARSGIDSAFIHEDKATDEILYRVRIGPVANATQYDKYVEKLADLGITDPYLIAE